MENRTLKTFALAVGIATFLAGTAFAGSGGTHSTGGKTGTSTMEPGGGSGAGTTPGTTPSAQPAPDAAAATPLTDPEIMGVLLAIDSNEVDVSKMAEKKKMSKNAAAYAKMLKDMHGKDAEKVKKLGKTLNMKPAISMRSKEIRSKGATMLNTLSAMSGQEFEKGFIEAMTTGHTEALQTIDTALMPNAQSEQVKMHLTEARGMVSAHLEQAKRLQDASASAPMGQ